MHIEENKKNVENTEDKGKKEKTPYSAFYYKKDRLNQIRGFCSLVQEGDIVKAAFKSGVEAATISKQIKALQRDLGAHLFQEKHNLKGRLVLSEEGERFYERAILLVQNMDSIYREFAASMEYERNNILRIAGVNFILSDILPKYIYKLKAMEEFKDLVIEICDIPREEAFKRLASKEIDIAFYSDKQNFLNKEVEIEKKIITTDEICLICRKEHPLTKIKNLKKEYIEKYPYLFLKSYSTYNPKEIFNFTKKDFVFENLDWNLMKRYLINSDNLLLVTENFCKNIINIKDNYAVINVSKFMSPAGVYYFLIKNMEMKQSLKYLKNLILEENTN